MNLQRNVQHAFTRDNAFSVGQRMAKSFLQGRWTTLLLTSVSYGVQSMVDTSHYRYNFLGEHYASSAGQGEVGFGPKDSHDQLWDVRAQFRLGWRPVVAHGLLLNAVYRYAQRVPHDSLADSQCKYTVSGYPAQLHALVVGLAYRLNLFWGSADQRVFGQAVLGGHQDIPGVPFYLFAARAGGVVFGYGNATSYRPWE